MRLLTAPFDPSARAPSALARPLLEVALIAAGGIALLLAADTLAGTWRGLGRAAASGGGHAAMSAAGYQMDRMGQAPDVAASRRRCGGRRLPWSPSPVRRLTDAGVHGLRAEPRRVPYR